MFYYTGVVNTHGTEFELSQNSLRSLETQSYGSEINRVELIGTRLPNY